MDNKVQTQIDDIESNSISSSTEQPLDLQNLKTIAKENVIESINELTFKFEQIVSETEEAIQNINQSFEEVEINDSETNLEQTWSSDKIQESLNNIKNSILGGVSESYNTLNKIENIIIGLISDIDSNESIINLITSRLNSVEQNLSTQSLQLTNVVSEATTNTSTLSDLNLSDLNQVNVTASGSSGQFLYSDGLNWVPYIIPNFFTSMNANNELITADTLGDTISLVKGDGVKVDSDAAQKMITFSSETRPMLYWTQNVTQSTPLNSLATTILYDNGIRTDKGFSVSAGEITVSFDGWVKIIHTVGATIDSIPLNGIAALNWWLEIFDGNNWSTIPNSSINNYQITDGGNFIPGYSHIRYQVSNGNKIRGRFSISTIGSVLVGTASLLNNIIDIERMD